MNPQDLLLPGAVGVFVLRKMLGNVSDAQQFDTTDAIHPALRTQNVALSATPMPVGAPRRKHGHTENPWFAKPEAVDYDTPFAQPGEPTVNYNRAFAKRPPKIKRMSYQQTQKDRTTSEWFLNKDPMLARRVVWDQHRTPY